MTPPPPPLKDAASGAMQRFRAPGAIRRIIPLVFSVAFALAGAALARNWYRNQERAFARQKQQLQSLYEPAVPVLAAAADLPVGTAIGPSQVTTIGVPKQFIQPYAARSPNDVMGLVTAVPIAEGEQLLTNKLRRSDQAPETLLDATLSTLTPKGKRAVTIAVDSITGVGGFVRPGDKVDILWTLKLPGAPQQGEQVATLTIFQEVSVLAVGGEMAGRPRSRDGTSPPAGQAAQYTVTLALTPQETSALLFAREQGRIQLSLRPRQEAGQVPIPPANINTVLAAQLGVSTTEPAPQVTHHVEIYKGLKRDVMVLAEEEEQVAR